MAIQNVGKKRIQYTSQKLDQISLRITNDNPTCILSIFSLPFWKPSRKGWKRGRMVNCPIAKFLRPGFLPSFSPTPVQSINHGWRGPRALDQRCFRDKKNLVLHVFEMPCSLRIFRRSKDLHPSGRVNTRCQDVMEKSVTKGSCKKLFILLSCSLLTLQPDRIYEAK